jgi:DNA-binding transcriptional MerR regulator
MNETSAETNLVRKTELAKLLGVSNRTLDNWVAQRLIPYIAISSRLHLFDPVAVRRVLAARFAVDARVT